MRVKMTISVGDRLPEAGLLRMGANGAETVSLGGLTKGRSVVIFAVPGAFSTTCDKAHVPSFIRAMPELRRKGVEDVICLAVNDPFVMKAWGESTGATAAGIHMLSDGDGAYTQAVGLALDAPAVGFHGRSQRYAMHVVDGVVKVLRFETQRGACEMTAGASLAEAI